MIDTKDLIRLAKKIEREKRRRAAFDQEMGLRLRGLGIRRRGPNIVTKAKGFRRRLAAKTKRPPKRSGSLRIGDRDARGHLMTKARFESLKRARAARYPKQA